MFNILFQKIYEISPASINSNGKPGQDGSDGLLLLNPPGCAHVASEPPAKILSICFDATWISHSAKHIAIMTFLILTLHQRGLLISNPTLWQSDVRAPALNKQRPSWAWARCSSWHPGRNTSRGRTRSTLRWPTWSPGWSLRWLGCPRCLPGCTKSQV